MLVYVNTLITEINSQRTQASLFSKDAARGQFTKYVIVCVHRSQNRHLLQENLMPCPSGAWQGGPKHWMWWSGSGEAHACHGCTTRLQVGNTSLQDTRFAPGPTGIGCIAEAEAGEATGRAAGWPTWFHKIALRRCQSPN